MTIQYNSIFNKFYLLTFIYAISILSLPQVNAAEYEHNIGEFGSSFNDVKQNLQGKCDKLKSRTIKKMLSVAKKTQRQLECTGFEYFGKKRFVEMMFSEGKLDIIHIMDIRDMLPDLKHMLVVEFGEPSLSTLAVDYFAIAGISLRVFPDEISFVSKRAKEDFSQYINKIKDNTLNMSLTKQEWLQDLSSLDVYIRNNHINPFWHHNESGYMDLYYQARDYITNTEKVDYLLVNDFIEQMVAYIADGHSYVANRDKRFGFYPYKADWFSDGLFITKTDEENKHLLGAKILAFDDTPTDIAAEITRKYQPIVNTSSPKLFSQFTFQYAGLLYAANIAKRPDTIALTLKLINGETIIHQFNKDVRDYYKMDFVNISELNIKEKPMYRQHGDLSRWAARWVKYIAKEDAIYVYYGSVVEQDDGEIAKFSQEIMHLVESKKPSKLIIDVRNNGGGDSHLNAPLINAIAKNSHINQQGKLFVITGRNSFSAAINFSGNMEVKTKALFAGEKVGDSASFAGEAGSQSKYRLPNSHIIISLSFSEWNTTYDNDKRDSVALDIPIAISSRDLLAGYDPVLKAVLDYKIQMVKAKDINHSQQHKWLGRYDFSADKALKISEINGRLHMEITELAFSELYAVSPTEMSTDMNGIQLKMLVNGNIELVQQGGENRELVKLDDDDLKPLELVILGQFAQAKAAYVKLHEMQPKLLSIRGNSMGVLATHIRARHNSQKLYDQIREITVAMHGFPIDSWLDH